MAHQHSLCLPPPLRERPATGAPRGDCRGGRAGWAGIARSRSGRGHRRTSPPPPADPAVRRQWPLPQPKTVESTAGAVAWIPKLPPSGRPSPAPPNRMFRPIDAARWRQCGRGVCHNRSDPTQEDSPLIAVKLRPSASRQRLFFSQLTAVAGSWRAPGAPAGGAAARCGCSTLIGRLRHSRPALRPGKPGRSGFVGQLTPTRPLALLSGHWPHCGCGVPNFRCGSGTLTARNCWPIACPGRNAFEAGRSAMLRHCPRPLLPLGPRWRQLRRSCSMWPASDGRSPTGTTGPPDPAVGGLPPAHPASWS